MSDCPDDLDPRTLRWVADDFDARAKKARKDALDAVRPERFSGTSIARQEMHEADAARFVGEAARLRFLATDIEAAKKAGAK